MRKTYGDIDSKFKFVLVASKRAKQLLKGASPKLKSKSKSLIRVAQQEVRKGLVDFEIVMRRPEEEYKAEDQDFIGEEISEEAQSREQSKEEVEKKSEKEEKKKAKGRKEENEKKEEKKKKK
ncbi:MAG: DNA-directed RNA polymerase subunit omega [Candidatus Aminicenantes bacterium]